MFFADDFSAPFTTILFLLCLAIFVPNVVATMLINLKMQASGGAVILSVVLGCVLTAAVTLAVMGGGGNPLLRVALATTPFIVGVPWLVLGNARRPD